MTGSDAVPPSWQPALGPTLATPEARRLGGFLQAEEASGKRIYPPRGERLAALALTPLDQALGSGTGSARTFALKKTYASGPAAWTRAIVKPVAGSVRVAVGGVETTAFTLDATTGVVTLTTAPANGAAVSAGFEFDVPVRFDADSLAINLAGFRAGEIPSIPLVEIRV